MQIAACEAAEARASTRRVNWRNPSGRAEIESALDEGRLYVQSGPGRWWLCRRGGQTQRWKRDATRFRTPIKAGLRFTDSVTEKTSLTMLRIADGREAAERRGREDEA